METAPLKSFATWARTTLISEVTARIAVVLAPGSSARVERSNVVTTLEKVIQSAGGGELGRASVADMVAYTWFNRIIALRFMDANSYTGIGIVSPERGRDSGQPEILAEAKRGNIDSSVVSNQHTVETVTNLLNGTRRSEDPQGEAFSLLLANYCRFWNRSMPFMFERDGDFTELLMPGNLLADDSVMASAVTVLTEEVCKDVEVIGWLYQFYISERKDEVFAGFKKNKKAGAAEIPAATQLFTPDWIVRYVVENSLGRLWLLNRPTSRIADQMKYYIAPVDEEIDFLKISSPEDLKIIDPACGSGHMLTYAFDLLYAIYDEEGTDPADIPGLILANNLFGTEIDPRAGALAAFALTMKARSYQRTFFTKQVKPNICVIKSISFSPAELGTLAIPGGDPADEEAFWNQFQYADILGSLIQPEEKLIGALKRHINTQEETYKGRLVGDIYARATQALTQAEYLSSGYHVAVANPPYMGRKNMNNILAAFAGQKYPDTKTDLFSMFIERCCNLCLDRGQLGFMTPFVWMFISSYNKLRQKLTQHATITSLIQLEYSGFEGATVPICTFTIENSAHPGYSGSYIKLSDFVGSELQKPKALEAIQNPDVNWFYRAKSQDYENIPGTPIAYSLPKNAIRAYREFDNFGSHSYGQPGLQTSDNARFVRLWHEVDTCSFNYRALSSREAQSSRARWFPLVKGGEFRKWYGNLEYVVDWEDSGARIKDSINKKYPYLNGNIDYVVKDRGYFFRPSINYNKITSGRFTARYAPAGTIFDVAGSAVFPYGNPMLALAFLGSKTGDFFVRAQNPTLNVQSGDIARLPYPESALTSRAATLTTLVQNAIDISRRDWDSAETAWEFTCSPLVHSYSAQVPLGNRVSSVIENIQGEHVRLSEVETLINYEVAKAYGLDQDINPYVSPEEVTLRPNNKNLIVRDLVSYAIGCMFGRYSIDEPGLILANHGDTLQNYLAKIPDPSFMPDADNVIPIIDSDWFEDDIVALFRQFLRVAFGNQHFEENLRFITEALGVKNLRDYFVKSFFKDHVQRYKKRPIYWLFSSPKGSFSALIYMHRYTTSTVSTVLNEYLREFKAKLEASRQHHERLAAGTCTAREKATSQKEADRLRKVLLELDEYEHDVLYPLATQQIQIDLSDGVKANYPKFGNALKKIPGLEAKDD